VIFRIAKINTAANHRSENLPQHAPHRDATTAAATVRHEVGAHQ
jgi:hypothetical protein